jgi:hypothetical protein
MVTKREIRAVMAEFGRKGGSVTGVKKGFGALTEEKRKEMSRRGVEARRAKAKAANRKSR